MNLDWRLRPDRFGPVCDGACRDWGKGSGAMAPLTGHEWMAEAVAAGRAGNSEFGFAGITLEGEAEQA